MSEDSTETRGERVKAIRDLLGLIQDAFADRLNDAARDLKLPAIYHTSKVSKMETGNRGVSLDDAYVVAAVDPHGRGVDWITFGVVVGKAGIVADPRKQPRKNSGRRA